MQKLLAHAVLLVTLIVPGAAVRASSMDRRAVELERLSQAFSDASASNDTKTLGRLLDANVTFVNESGEMATKADLTTPSDRTQAGVSHKLAQTDFHVKFHGNVAVTDFVDVATNLVYGQTVDQRYLSTEVWLDEAGAWKMVSSQTLALATDPPAVVLGDDLDQYVGSYDAGGHIVSISRAGNDLVSTLAGSQTTLKAELRDVFFIAGRPRYRRIFERDPSGKISGFIGRTDGHDVRFIRVG